VPTDLLNRIAVDPGVCGGRPCIKGHRVGGVAGTRPAADGDSVVDVVDENPGLDVDDVRACIAYGAKLASADFIDGVSLKPSNRSHITSRLWVIRADRVRQYEPE
jgi:uncharacterized protein (DUF433 family)